MHEGIGTLMIVGPKFKFWPDEYKTGLHKKWDMDTEDASLDEGSLRLKEMDADLQDEVRPELAMDELN
ncbi:hypothetical protein PIB30_044121 [Stylosanthes scabra]|uniref:Uncharacterized protein n=1 Tax=Stylosanthes scabra TaxID=79078 RepID=A0ABU6SFU8_9FABA|nr:hypothetical protein [Stylosanthes scabra]